MSDLQGTETHRHLEQSFARESQAAMRYRFFAQEADIEGEPEVANRFRLLADAATGHALGHLELLAEVADPATGRPIDDTEQRVASATESETTDHAERYPRYADVANAEGFGEVGAWMGSLAKADHADRLLG